MSKIVDLNARVAYAIDELTRAAEILTTINELNPGEAFSHEDTYEIKRAKEQARRAFYPINDARGCVQAVAGRS